MTGCGRQRDFRGRRWLTVVLRGFHLVAVIWLGALLMGAEARVPPGTAAVAVLVTGLLMFALDIWSRPRHLREMAGLGMILKLGMVAAMAAAPQWGTALFWGVVVWSAVFSHAPASFRNAAVFGR